MADTLYVLGKVLANTGIKENTNYLSLRESNDSEIANVSFDHTTDFEVVAGTGQLRNTSALSFTIASGDVGKTANHVVIQQFDTSTYKDVVRIDLDTPLLLQTEGTATFAIGDLTVDL